MRQRISNYLSISKKEWNGMVVLLIAILLVLAAPYVYQRLHKDKPISFKDFDKAAAELHARETAARKLPSVTAYASNKLTPDEQVEINTADSATFTKVHGIGPSFARRIIAYRKRLGGFVNKEQLKEVYGLDEEKYAEINNEIRLDKPDVKTIPINNVELDELRRFPYVTYKQANAIIQYRAQHGNYNSINDMRDIAILNDNILRKIAPYITFK